MLGNAVAVDLASLDELHECGLDGVGGLSDIVNEAGGEGLGFEELAEIAEGQELGEVDFPVLDDGGHSLEVGGVRDGGVHEDEIGLGGLGGLGDDIGLSDARGSFDEDAHFIADGVGEELG